MESEKTILCVEDDNDTCELITFVFQNEGFQIVGCSTPEEGIRRARSGKYAAIITDFYFGEMDGTDFCRAVSAFDRNTPIIFFTGEARPDKKKSAMEAGAQAYITKPTDFEQFAQTVIELINKGGDTKWLYLRKPKARMQCLKV